MKNILIKFAELAEEEISARLLLFVLLFVQMIAAWQIWDDSRQYLFVLLCYLSFGAALPFALWYMYDESEPSQYILDAIDICVLNILFKLVLFFSYVFNGEFAKLFFNFINDHISFVNWSLFSMAALRMIWVGGKWPVFGVVGFAVKFGVIKIPGSDTKGSNSPIFCYILILLSFVLGGLIDSIKLNKALFIYICLALILFVVIICARHAKSIKNNKKKALAAINLERANSIEQQMALSAAHALDRGLLKDRAIAAEQDLSFALGAIHTRQFEAVQAGVVSVTLDGTGNPINY